MKVKVSKVKPTKFLLKIEVPQDIVSQKMDTVYKEIGKVANIPGFRKGKVPREILEKHHGQDAKDEALKQLIPESYQQAIREHDIMPISLPQIQGVKFEAAQPLYFEATIDVKPEVKLKKYKGLKIKKRKVEVAEKEVDETLEGIRERFAEYKPIEGRPVQEGDYVVADYEAKEGDGEVEKKENAWFFVKDDGRNLKEIVSALKGANNGDKLKVEAVMPKEHFKKELAGKKIEFNIEVKEIKEKNLPPVDEEFVKNLGQYESLEKLKDAIRDDIKHRKEHEVKADTEQQIAQQLIKLNPVEAPESMVNQQLEELIKQVKQRLMYQGLKEEDIKAREPEIRNNMLKQAEDQVKIYFILDEIIKQEDIKVAEEDRKKHIDKIAQHNRTTPDKIKEMIDKNDTWSSLDDQIRHEKALDLLIEEASVKEVK